MSSNSLVIVSQEQTIALALQDALGQVFENVTLQDDFSALSVGDKEQIIFVFLTDGNKEKAKKFAADNCVIGFIKTANEVDDALFEMVFTTPLRLGYAVEKMKELVQQRERRRSLSLISLGDVILDPRTLVITHEAIEKSAHLTEKEFDILIFLSQNLRRPVARQILLDKVWGYANTVETHTLETHIYRLRQKLKNQLSLDDFLVTQDDGYILNI